mgnify:CR=1 FL=1
MPPRSFNFVELREPPDDKKKRVRPEAFHRFPEVPPGARDTLERGGGQGGERRNNWRCRGRRSSCVRNLDEDYARQATKGEVIIQRRSFICCAADATVPHVSDVQPPPLSPPLSLSLSVCSAIVRGGPSGRESA